MYIKEIAEHLALPKLELADLKEMNRRYRSRGKTVRWTEQLTNRGSCD
jgi:hypothetical protein